MEQQATIKEPDLPLGEEEFLAWVHSPATQAVWQGLERQVSLACKNWMEGNYQVADPNVTQRLNMEVLTRVDTLKGLIKMSYEDFKELFRD